MIVDFGRDICGDETNASQREWLVTNGIGGFAAGTVAGILTRHYHGLLVAALNPPLGRTVLLTRVDENVSYGDQIYPLYANRWNENTPAEPAGFQYLERFQLKGTTPVWTYAISDALLEKRVWMQPGKNTTYIRYDVVRASGPVTFHVKTLVNYRDFHGGTYAGDWQMQVEPVADGLRLTAYDGAMPFFLFSKESSALPKHVWYRDYHLSTEAARGLDTHDDNLHAGTFSAELNMGDTLTLVATTDSVPSLDGAKAYDERHRYEAGLLKQANLGDAPDKIRQLVLAADQFVVQRDIDGESGNSVIAGYHWFGDWGRDTMISLPGLTLSTGRYDVASQILRTFAKFVDRGMLPNRFPDKNQEPEYNTIDATLWYFRAIHATYESSADRTLLQDLYPVLQNIIDHHYQGTRYGIMVDPVDNLLRGGEDGVQLTWMDAKVGDWVVTPRIGKPVEVNALWLNALASMEFFAKELNKDDDAARFAESVVRVKEGFGRFWNAEQQACYDVIDFDEFISPNSLDASLRPNQIFAVSLPVSPLSASQQKAVVDVCARKLLTSFGLRSLAPEEPGYRPAYGGDVVSRDGAYHQGTVWGWLIGPFVEAHLRVYGDKQQARAFLLPLIDHHQQAGCVGSMSEIFDGDPPFVERGAVAQAWTVAEVLRAWRLTE